MQENEQKYIHAEIDTAIISGLAAVVGCVYIIFNVAPVSLSSQCGFVASLIVSFFQIYYAYKNDLKGRNWSNFFNALASIYMSISLTLGYGDVSAIGGFMAVGILSIKYWWFTSRVIKHKNES